MNFELFIRFEKETRQFLPRERIEGRVIVQAPMNWQAYSIKMELFWRTEGRGNSEREVVTRKLLCPRDEYVPPDFKQPFHFTAPVFPKSYSGKLIKLHWWVGLYARALGDEERFLEVPVRIDGGLDPYGTPELPPPAGLHGGPAFTDR